MAQLLTGSVHGAAKILMVIGRLNTSSLVWAQDWLQKAGEEDGDWSRFKNDFLQEHEVQRTALSALEAILAKPQRLSEENSRQYKERCEREFSMVPWKTYYQEDITLPPESEAYIIRQLRANMEPGHPMRVNRKITTWEKFVEATELMAQPSDVPGDSTWEEHKMRSLGPQQSRPAARSAGWSGKGTATTPTAPRAAARAPQQSRTVTLGDRVIEEEEYDQFVQAVGEDEVARVVCEEDRVDQLGQLFQRFSLLARHRSQEERANAMRAFVAKKSSNRGGEQAGPSNGSRSAAPPQQQRQGQNQSAPKAGCFTCGDAGHFSRYCPNKTCHRCG
ncbi:hypothetical protein BGZ73_001702, partial [Actinomortierella ambigua]